MVLALFGQRGIRRRARRLNAQVAAGGGGVWLGSAPIDEVDPLWAGRVPALVSLAYSRDGYPVRLVAETNGIVLHPRGLLLPRLPALAPVLIPWGDLAGARASGLGYSTDSRTTLWLVPLTRITLDLVGRSAGTDPDAIDADADEPSLDEDLEERAEEEAFWREEYGEDWRIGTEPFHFTTTDSTGLVDMVITRCLGHPASTVLPEP